MAKNTIQKNIRFPSVIVKEIERKAKRLGMNFNEYVKYLVVREADDTGIPTIYDEQLVADIIQAHKDAKAGKLSILRTDEDIDAYLQKGAQE